jgi:hypothetical protein
LPDTGFSLSAFTWADRITNLCDMIAFHFSFGEPTESTLAVCPRLKSPDETPITYSLDDQGTITVSPWPFSVDSYRGFIVGYRAEGYPDRLEPEILNWWLVPGRAS